MTIAKKRQASNILEKKKLIQDIKQKNPEISEAQLSRYNIDDLKKIQMAVGQEYYKDALEKEKGLRLGIDRQKMQYGGMADMSAAPMIKQPQRKKRKASGFRAKYSKGGGIRKSKYSLQTMPLTKKGKKIKASMTEQYGSKKAEQVFYASKNKGSIKGVDKKHGGMADMSAAPMIKQPQTKKRKASGFRTKYSKGGGVRKSKYKL